MRNEQAGIAYFRLLSGIMREMVVVWKKVHGAEPQKKQPQLYLGHVHDGEETATRTGQNLEEHSGGDTSVVLGDEYSTMSQV